MRTDFEYVLVQQQEGVLTLTLNRPKVLNAFNDGMIAECAEVLQAAAQDESVRCVVLTGAGRAFGAGQDLSAFAERTASGSTESVSQHLRKYHQLVHAIRDMPKPVVAAIRGVATGISLNIALACDLRIATHDARFSEAFARIGLVPDGGGAYFLPRLIGMGKAMEMALLANEVNGVEAERLGLVNKSVPEEEFEATVTQIAQRLAQGPTHAYSLIKTLFYQGEKLDLAGLLELEGRMQDEAIQTADHNEGVTAFREKRTPNYQGR